LFQNLQKPRIGGCSNFEDIQKAGIQGSVILKISKTWNQKFLDLQKSESAEPELIYKIRDLHNTGSLFSLN
jgi:hypothetical protein